MMILYTDHATSVHTPLAVGGNILIKVIMLYVPSFAIVRLSVLARPNPDMSRSRARGRPGMTHECRRRIKIVDFKGGNCQFVRPGQLVFAVTQPTRQACNTTCQPAFSPVEVHDPARGALPGEVVAARHGRTTLFCDASLRL